MKERAGSLFSEWRRQAGKIFGTRDQDANANEPQLLRSKERYRRALISGGSAVFSRLVWILTLLISVPLTVKYLGPERYGMWMTISSLIALLQFADLGIGYGLLNAVAGASGKDDTDAAKKYISSGFFYLLGLSVLIGIVFGLIYTVIPWGAVYNVSSAQAIGEAGPATAFFAILFLANIPLSIVGKVQQGYQEGYVDSMWQAMGRILSLIFLLIVIWLQLGLPWLVLAIAGTPVLAQLANFIVHFFERPEIRPSLPYIKRESAYLVLRTGFLFFILQLVISVAFAADTIVLAQIIGPAAVAVYTITFQVFLFIPTLVRVFLHPLWPAYGEATSRGDFQWAETTFSRSLKSSLIVTGLSAAFLALFGGKLIEIWAGPEVIPPTMLLLSIGVNSVLLYGWGDPVAMFLNGTGKVAFEVSWAIPMAIANIVISIVLTQRIGISGVAWGTSISYFLLMFIPTTVFLKSGRASRNPRKD